MAPGLQFEWEVREEEGEAGRWEEEEKAEGRPWAVGCC